MRQEGSYSLPKKQRLSSFLISLLSISICFLGFGARNQAEAATYYVNNSNSCPGTGTTGDPYCAIQNAVNVALVGDDIRIQKTASAYNEEVYPVSSGTAVNPITIESDNPADRPNWYHIANGQTYCGDGNGRCAAFDLEPGRSYWTLKNLLFDGTGVWTGGQTIWAEGSNTGIKILNNIFKNLGGTETQQSTGCSGAQCDSQTIDANGMDSTSLIDGNVFDAVRLFAIASNGLSTPQAPTISNNEFKNITYGKNSDDGIVATAIHVIYYAGDATHQAPVPFNIKNNTFHDFQHFSGAGACGLDFNGAIYYGLMGVWADASPTNGTVDSNLFYNLGNNGGADVGTAIFMEDATQRWVIKNNIIYDVEKGIAHSVHAAIRTITDYNYYYNNTIYNTVSNGIQLNSGWAKVENNLISGAGGYQIDAEAEATTVGHLTIDHNLYYSTNASKIGNWNNTSDTFSSWKTACGCDGNSVSADPLFVSTSTPDFHLQSSSPAINAGIDVGLTIDYDGGTVPAGAAPDIGAYEYGSEMSTPENIWFFFPIFMALPKLLFIMQNKNGRKRLWLLTLKRKYKTILKELYSPYLFLWELLKAKTASTLHK